MNCPVCPRTDIAAGVLDCPNCGVDLRPLLRLRELPRYRTHLAAELLAAGHPDEAAQKLQAALEDGADTPHTRLLLGKAWLRLGNREEAARQLKSAAKDPAIAADAQLALRECTETHESGVPAPSTTTVQPAAPPAARVVPLWVAVTLAATSVLSLLLALTRGGGAASSADVGRPAAPRVEAAFHAPPASSAQKAGDAPSPSAPTAPATSPGAAERKALERALSGVEGIRVDSAPADLRVVFLESLFDGDSFALERSSRRRLAAVAEALEAYGRPLAIVVRGFTVPRSLGPDGDAHDGWMLGFNRASAALVQLHSSRQSHLTWRAMGSDRVEPPFTAEDERAKNRTVVLEISLTAGGG
jgi:outer membrane protein OmpA-like peptidoglycan-associated protein